MFLSSLVSCRNTIIEYNIAAKMNKLEPRVSTSIDLKSIWLNSKARLGIAWHDLHRVLNMQTTLCTWPVACCWLSTPLQPPCASSASQGARSLWTTCCGLPWLCQGLALANRLEDRRKGGAASSLFPAVLPAMAAAATAWSDWGRAFQ